MTDETTTITKPKAIKPTTTRALLYAVPLFLTPVADEIVPIMKDDAWPSFAKLVACVLTGIIAMCVGLRAYFDGSYQRFKDGKSN